MLLDMQTTEAASQLVRFKEACQMLGMSVDSGAQHARNGTFPVPILIIGKIRKVRRGDIERLVAGEVADGD